jgi:hypothetical protein
MKTVLVVICILFFQIPLFAQNKQQDIELKLDSLSQEVLELSKELKELKTEKRDNELAELRKAAKEEMQIKEKKEELTKKTFQEGARSLQELNPEISISTDMLANYKTEAPHYTDESRSGFKLRVVEFMFQSNLDPFSFTKIIVEAGHEGVEVGEAYVTWVNLFNRFNLTAGKFRQQFGVVNRWHGHALDQTFFPLPITLYMGEEGLNQIGLSFNWLMPSLTANANELTLQITNSQNEELFGGEEYSLPSGLVHFKNFYDLNPSTYLEVGFTGLAGTNDDIGFTFSEDHTWTYMAGADLTLVWEPVNRARYKGVTWRSEGYYLYRQQNGNGDIEAIGGYSYLEYRLSRRFIVGARVDIAQPPELNNGDTYLWQTVPYITFWQSEFVYMRLQWNHLDGNNIDEKDNQVFFQIDWSIGPHKHEKY